MPHSVLVYALLPQIQYTNQIPQPKEGLLHFNRLGDELEFFDGFEWKRTFSLAEDNSKFDFKRSVTDNTGVDGALFSIYNTHMLVQLLLKLISQKYIFR